MRSYPYRRWLDIIAYTVALAAVVGFVLAQFKAPGWMQAQHLVIQHETVAEPLCPGDTLRCLRQAAATGMAAVVAIAPPESAFEQLLKRLPPDHPPFAFPPNDSGEEEAVEIGSGVILNPEGLVLTNAHVVSNHATMRARLADGREVMARVIGRDAETDLAVLQLPQDTGPYPSLAIAPEGSYQVGDVVLAIGHPFGVGQTVTQGIISALNRRDLGISTFENFIQTDAAINPGNSGGALVDLAGRLIGINTAIYSQTGGNIGIGFAIPMPVALPVVRALLEQGKVVRGWLGVQLQPLTPELIELFAVPEGRGVLVSAVLAGSPAAEAGLQPGDVLLAINGTRLGSVRETLDAVAALAPGSRATLEVWRQGKRQRLTVIIGERPTSDGE